MIRRFLRWLFCRYDLHSLPGGFRQVEIDELGPTTMTFLVKCSWCDSALVAVAEGHLR